MTLKKDILANNSNKIIYTIDSYGNYQYCNTYDELEKIINKTQNICEYISDKIPVNLYFDIDVKASTDAIASVIDASVNNTLTTIHNKIKDKFSKYNIKRILLSSHGLTKKSYHIIYRFLYNNKEILFNNVASLKNLCIELNIDKLVNMQVYRDGLFRTYNSWKYNDSEKRIFIKDSSSDDFTFKESFVCYTISNNYDTININDNYCVTIPKNSIIQNNNKELSLVIEFLEKMYNRKISTICVPSVTGYITHNNAVGVEKTHYLFRLTETYCPFLKRYHNSNGQYIVFNNKCCYLKCFDEVCKNEKYKYLTTCKYSKKLKLFYSTTGAVKPIKTESPNIITIANSAVLNNAQLSYIKTFVLNYYSIIEFNITSITYNNSVITVLTNITSCIFIENINPLHKQYIEISIKESKQCCTACKTREKRIIDYSFYPINIQNIFVEYAGCTKASHILHQ